MLSDMQPLMYATKYSGITVNRYISVERSAAACMSSINMFSGVVAAGNLHMSSINMLSGVVAAGNLCKC
jgi:hypothetical protein